MLVWAAVPPGLNFDHRGRKLLPVLAALNFFLPGFDLYWMFRIHWLIVEAIEREAKLYKRKERGAKRLATAACVLTLVPGVNFVVAPVLWFLHMRTCDRAFAELRRGGG